LIKNEENAETKRVVDATKLFADAATDCDDIQLLLPVRPMGKDLIISLMGVNEMCVVFNANRFVRSVLIAMPVIAKQKGPDVATTWARQLGLSGVMKLEELVDALCLSEEAVDDIRRMSEEEQ